MKQDGEEREAKQGCHSRRSPSASSVPRELCRLKHTLEFVLSPGEGAGPPYSGSSRILAVDHPGDVNSQAFSALCLDKGL